MEKLNRNTRQPLPRNNSLLKRLLRLRRLQITTNTKQNNPTTPGLKKKKKYNRKGAGGGRGERTSANLGV
jgi:hypothetical protein